MTPIKRKTAPAEDGSRPAKKSRPTPSTNAVLKPETAFPRGGASALTPLEQKQIQIQAKDDVLFEQTTGKKAARPDFEEEDRDQNDGANLHKKARRSKSKKSSTAQTTKEPKSKGVRVESLSYSRLVPGSLVLGQVSEINQNDIALSLPNNLTGFIPITSISETLNERLEAFVEEAENDEAQDSSEPNIEKLFAIGQYVRASVVSTTEERGQNAQKKRHISLSTMSRQVNQGLSRQDLVKGATVQASVLSIEDHGYRMDLGLEDKTVHGFLSQKDLEPNEKVDLLQLGQTLLCLVNGQSSSGQTVKLTSDSAKMGTSSKGACLKDAPTVDAFMPGCLVDFTVSEMGETQLIGKVMGLLDVTADLVHTGAAEGKNLEEVYSAGKHYKGRVICTFPTSEEKKLGISLLTHVLDLKPKKSESKIQDKTDPLRLLPISSIVEAAKVVKVESGLGLYLDVGVRNIHGFAHISKLTDSKIESLSEQSGSFKLGSKHKARVTGYNSLDGMYIMSLEPGVLSQPFLRLEDVPVGEVVKGKIVKLLISGEGVSGLIVTIADGVTGLVPEIHLADVRLQHPERKFKEGVNVTARVLSKDLSKRQLRLTLKKTLVNSEAQPWTTYEQLENGMTAPGTLVNVLQKGAFVQFYGPVSGYLPAAEMSESYIRDPRGHFRNGQVVNVRVIEVDAQSRHLRVSCRDPTLFGENQAQAFSELPVGSIVEGTVSGKTNENITLTLPGDLNGILPIDHLTDGSSTKSRATAERIRLDQRLTKLLVLEKVDSRHQVRLTSKPSLVTAAQTGKMPQSFGDVELGMEVVGFVTSITTAGVFVQYLGNTSAALWKRSMTDDSQGLPNFGVARNQTVTAKVLSLDQNEEKFVLTTRSDEVVDSSSEKMSEDVALIKPIDESLKHVSDLSFGKITKARVKGVKATQVNVHLAEGVLGRVDMSSAIDTWQEIADGNIKHPLSKFKQNQIIDVRILGIHDSRNHRFLPISHRIKSPVYELTTKANDLKSPELDILTLDKVEVGSRWPVFVNNVKPDCLFVNLSPNVRGKIEAREASDNLEDLTDLAKAFPIGSALEATVLKVDASQNKLSLSARSRRESLITVESLEVGQTLPGRVTKITDHQVWVHISENVGGPIGLVDLADEYDKAAPWSYSKDQFVAVYVKQVDAINKKYTLSLRPSLLKGSTSAVVDADVRSVHDVKVNDIRRGFIKNIAENGIWVALSSNVEAFVRVGELSDSYIKDWKADFKIGQLVRGRIIAINAFNKRVSMSLKASSLDKDYKAPLQFEQVQKGQILTGTVRKVETYGVFVVIDDSANVSGLCHRSKLSDQKDVDPLKFYEEGHRVKAKVLHVDKAKKRLTFGLKASYFKKEPALEETTAALEISDIDSADGSVEEDDRDGGVAVDDFDGFDADEDFTVPNGHAQDDEMLLDDLDSGERAEPAKIKGLSAGAFDFTGHATFSDDGYDSGISDNHDSPPKKKKHKSSIKIDHTGDLDVHGPQTTADFERLLLGQPNNSTLWLGYMALHMKLGEIETARTIGERALKTIHIREQDEKQRIWIGLLNLEVLNGTDDSIEAVFRRACTYSDPLDMSERLISIYIQSDKKDKADDLFQATLKKHTQSPNLWLNYAQFLMDAQRSPESARALLSRALQALPTHTHVTLTSQFAKLEFDSTNGDDERGRTMFETLLSTWPKRLDLWNVLLDLEIKRGDKARVRNLFGRVVQKKVGMKLKKAKFFFGKWRTFEEKMGGGKELERVKTLEEKWEREWMEKKGEK